MTVVGKRLRPTVRASARVAGSVVRMTASGVWAGGLAYLICSRKSVELASRPMNVPRVKEQFTPDLYFSDTIFASPLYECFDPQHPLTLADDLRYKIALCDYLRSEE